MGNAHSWREYVTMTTWTINDYEIPGFVEKRDIATPWFQNHQTIYGRKAVLKNTTRDAKPFRMSIKLRGAGRYTAEAAIRDELKSDAVLIEASNKNIYKNKKTCWVTPTGFNVKDRDRTLTCDIAGLVDERTIHSCDFTTDWTGNSLSVVTGTRFGEGAIKDSSISSANNTIYTPTEAINLSTHAYISLWHKESKSITAFLRLFTNSDYYQWTLTADTSWTHETFALASPTATSGSPSLSNITSVRIYTSDTGSWDIYLGWVYGE